MKELLCKGRSSSLVCGSRKPLFTRYSNDVDYMVGVLLVPSPGPGFRMCAHLSGA